MLDLKSISLVQIFFGMFVPADSCGKSLQRSTCWTCVIMQLILGSAALPVGGFPAAAD